MPGKFSASQAQRMADAFQEVAGSIRKYLKANGASTSAAATMELKQARAELLAAANKLRNFAVHVSLDEVATAVEQIEATTDRLDEVIATVKSVKRWIELTTIAAQLAAAVSTGNGAGILEALQRAGAALEE